MKTCNWGFFPSTVVQHQCQLGLSYLSERRYICCVVVSFLSLLLLLFFFLMTLREIVLIDLTTAFLFETITVQYTQLCNTLNFLFFFFVFVIRYIVRLAVYTRPYSSIAMGYTKRTRMRHRGGQQQPAESCWIVHGSIRHVRSNSTK